ncbi:16S rRNA (cytosine(967)-C(5))-methyltransferase [Ammoniphilus oxalaticus]|uniref:16S rRNA (cytosine(967)-C(5))-methyltransferase n=1 Tax=Ammoniphilus oxalaticus TaxID=66863 RepID=A0A419SJC4_9BACL|nr:16S rRNA (cytosine(967)-C(5))-methyltransferase RsmB [Ammoniphilus oxalaticus]RKD24144.1 16S rRNA (cytosine(967)-C(5))-methyltransferase [Ammoniphilus oxalaticus]
MIEQGTQSARSLALDVLTEIERKDAFSNLELNAALNKANLTRREAGLATELVYGTLSRLNTLDWIATQFVKKPTHRLEPWLRNLLRLALYQLHYLDRIPDRAIVHEAVEEAKKHGHKGTVSLVNGVLRNYLREKEQLNPPTQWPKFKKIALEHSHPEWLVKRWLSAFGEKETIAMCKTNNLPPTLSVRVNTLRISKQAFIARLQQEIPDAVIEESLLSDVGLLVSHAGNIANSPLFNEGLCAIQDESSMLVGQAMDVQPEMAVLDTCAAPGGKTAHLAERMGNRGSILALDIHPHKLQLIDETVERLGITIVDTMEADARALPESFQQAQFDRILVDAPCSGFGVIRRKPDLKWQKQVEDITAIAAMQMELLEQAVRCLKPGGKLVYSTCTVDPEENGRLIHRFLDSHTEFELDPSLVDDMPPLLRERFHQSGAYIQILPHYFSSDGFFISRLRKRV